MRMTKTGTTAIERQTCVIVAKISLHGRAFRLKGHEHVIAVLECYNQSCLNASPNSRRRPAYHFCVCHNGLE